MTETATIIRMLEAEKEPTVQSAIVSRHPTDAIFRQVLELAYDPFVRFGLDGHPHVVPAPLSGEEEINGALQEEWAYFADAALEARGDLQSQLDRWADSKAWPVFSRVLRKGFEGVGFGSVNVWGTLPLVRPGAVSEDHEPPEPLFFGLIQPSYDRVLLVVRDPLESPITHFLDTGGDCISDTVAHELVVRANTFPYGDCELPSVYGPGLVLDGFLCDDRQLFFAADIVPLSRFKEQKATKPFEVRVGRLLQMKPHLDARFRLVDFMEVDDPGAVEPVRTAKNLDYPEAGVIAIAAGSSYPYSPSSAWTWLRKPGGM